VGDHEVECNPSFRLYLHTAAESHEIPAAIATYVLMIYFHMTRSDIEEELLHRFMAKEKSRVDEEKMGLLQVILLDFMIVEYFTCGLLLCFLAFALCKWIVHSVLENSYIK